MKINNKDYSVEDIVDSLNIKDDFLEKRSNGIMLSNYQIEVLKRNDIDYLKYNNVKELIFYVEEILEDNDDEELDKVLNDLSEIVYYNYTNK